MILYTRKHHLPFQIDRSDLEIVSRYTWRISSCDYPVTNIPTFISYNSQRTVFLHLLLLGNAPSGLEWDHRNRDRRDNRRRNLRLVTHGVNMRNRAIQCNSTTGVVGVVHRNNKWEVSIGFDGIRKYVGTFNTLEEATKARKDAEVRYWRDR